MSDTRKRLQIRREVAEQADSFYDQAETLGQVAAQQITDRHRSQITGLENIANIAMKVADVLDYIKIQSARRGHWRELGPALLKTVKTDLKLRKETVCSHLALEADSRDGQYIHLQLIREFVRQLAAQYEYCCKFSGEDECS